MSKNERIQLTTLPSGLRVITDHVPSVGSVALGIWAGVGTRNEDMRYNGIAHMVEHMLFKGTEKRTSAEISESIERVGGQMNAYTSREVTAYYAHLLKEDVSLAVDVLSDMVQNSTMPHSEIARERHVILHEIGMTLDTPDDWVFDIYQETAYPAQALGAPILGTSDIIAAMERESMQDYVRHNYTPKRLVVSAAGNVDHNEFVKLVEDALGNLPADQDFQAEEAHYQGGEVREEKDLEQAHIILGFEGVSRLDDNYYAAVLMGSVLGSGMSSRLFQEVREKRGLVYSVFSMHDAYQDTGQCLIYAGTGPDDLTELMPVLCEEAGKMTHTVTEEELERSKNRLKAGLLIGRESMKARVGQQAKHLIHFDEVLDIEERVAALDAVTVDDVHRMAKKVFSSAPTLAALGPLGKLELYDSLKARLAA